MERSILNYKIGVHKRIHWLNRELSKILDFELLFLNNYFQDVLEALLFPMVNEGYNLLERGMIADPALIDIMLWVHSFSDFSYI